MPPAYFRTDDAACHSSADRSERTTARQRTAGNASCDRAYCCTLRLMGNRDAVAASKSRERTRRQNRC